jgi:hypothetical protein
MAYKKAYLPCGKACGTVIKERETGGNLRLPREEMG